VMASANRCRMNCCCTHASASGPFDAPLPIRDAGVKSPASSPAQARQAQHPTTCTALRSAKHPDDTSHHKQSLQAGGPCQPPLAEYNNHQQDGPGPEAAQSAGLGGYSVGQNL
jgi:hypothetical protein